MDVFACSFNSHVVCGKRKKSVEQWSKMLGLLSRFLSKRQASNFLFGICFRFFKSCLKIKEGLFLVQKKSPVELELSLLQSIVGGLVPCLIDSISVENARAVNTTSDSYWFQALLSQARVLIDLFDCQFIRRVKIGKVFFLGICLS